MATDQTQKKIMDAFTELLEHQSFASIKVTNIVAAAGVSHMSFYRKYADKYALLEEICYQDFTTFSRIYGKDATWKETVQCLLTCAKSNRQFYKKIFADDQGLDSAIQATIRLSTDYTGKAASEFARLVWKNVLRNWARNGMADSVKDIYQNILEHLPICDILTEEERQIYLHRYEETSLADFRGK